MSSMVLLMPVVGTSEAEGAGSDGRVLRRAGEEAGLDSLHLGWLSFDLQHTGRLLHEVLLHDRHLPWLWRPDGVSGGVSHALWANGKETWQTCESCDRFLGGEATTFNLFQLVEIP